MKFHIHRLGCPKNDVDADYIAARLIADGHEPVGKIDDAETLIVNTCGFILPAKEESINEILRLSRLKEETGLKHLFATGCLTQRYGDELLKEIPELDGVFGVGALDALAEAVGSGPTRETAHSTEAHRLNYIDYEKRFISDRLPYAYIKISDGCDRSCSFCSIPAIRGSYRSRPMQSILNEATYLAENGKNEIILVSQESTLYGMDLKQGYGILQLLKELDAIENLAWIRLMYLYPTQVSDDLLEYILNPDNKILPYFDLPLQHVSDGVLNRMSRHTTRVQTEAIVKKIRSGSDKTAIRTTFIVGFPGETEEEFDELREFVNRCEFDRLGVFTFSPEEGTVAETMTDQVPEEVKVDRMDEIMTLQFEIATIRNNSLIGKVMDVIIDSVNDDGRANGRTEADCPEIDQEVLVTGDHFEVGSIIPVRIEAVDGYDLAGSKLSG